MSTTTDTAAPASRPGGRSARVRAAVHRAVEEMVGETADTVDPPELTIPAVAARAGVHPTTVYRRWGSVGELLTAVAEHRFSGGLVVPDTGSLRGDLERWATDVAQDLADPDVLALMRATLGAGGYLGANACVADRHEQIAAMLERERSRGGAPLELDHVVDGVLAPLYYRALFADGTADPELPARLVARLV